MEQLAMSHLNISFIHNEYVLESTRKYDVFWTIAQVFLVCAYIWHLNRDYIRRKWRVLKVLFSIIREQGFRKEMYDLMKRSYEEGRTIGAATPLSFDMMIWIYNEKQEEVNAIIDRYAARHLHMLEEPMD